MNKKISRSVIFITFVLGATLDSECISEKLKRCDEYDTKCTRKREKEVKVCIEQCENGWLACATQHRENVPRCAGGANDCKKRCYNSRGWDIPSWMKVYF